MSKPRINPKKSKALRNLLKRNQGNKCHWCQCEMNEARRPGSRDMAAITLDHVLPRRSGGSNDLSNLVAACYGCNNRRNHEHQLELQLVTTETRVCNITIKCEEQRENTF